MRGYSPCSATKYPIKALEGMAGSFGLAIEMNSIMTGKAKQLETKARWTNYIHSQESTINRKWGQTINCNPVPPSDLCPPTKFHLFKVPNFSNNTLTWGPHDKHKPDGGISYITVLH